MGAIKPYDKFDDKRRDFLLTLEECFGNITRACHKQMVDRQLVYYWMDHVDGFGDAVNKARKKGRRLRYDALVDVIEETAIVGRDYKAALKILERNYKKGADDDSESWTTRVEHTGENGSPMELIQFYMPENSRDDEEDEDDTD